MKDKRLVWIEHFGGPAASHLDLRWVSWKGLYHNTCMRLIRESRIRRVAPFGVERHAVTCICYASMRRWEIEVLRAGALHGDACVERVSVQIISATIEGVVLNFGIADSLNEPTAVEGLQFVVRVERGRR